MMGTMRCTILQSLGEIKQRVPAVGAKIWCLYMFFVVVVFCHGPRPARCSFEGDIL